MRSTTMQEKKKKIEITEEISGSDKWKDFEKVNLSTSGLSYSILDS